MFLTAAYGLGLALWPVIRWGSRGYFAGLGLLAVTPFTPLLIAPEHGKIRAVACLMAIDLFFRSTDYARQWRQGSLRNPRFIPYFRFLFPFPLFAYKFGSVTRGPRFISEGWPGTVGAGGAVLFCFGFLHWAAGSETLRTSFLLDHTIKFVTFPMAVGAVARTLTGVERLAGFRVPPLVHKVWRARTVGSFWQRFNTRVHSWCSDNIYSGAARHLSGARPVFLTFFISALLHEIGFAVASSHVDGYQFLFFMLQAPAVIIWHRVDRAVRKSAPGRLVLHAATIVWFWVTSLFFFRGVDRIFPLFYVAEPWLP